MQELQISYDGRLALQLLLSQQAQYMGHRDGIHCAGRRSQLGEVLWPGHVRQVGGEIEESVRVERRECSRRKKLKNFEGQVCIFVRSNILIKYYLITLVFIN